MIDGCSLELTKVWNYRLCDLYTSFIDVMVFQLL